MKQGSEYEQFVASLYKALIDSEDLFKQKNIIVQINKKIVDNFGIEREFDIYWEYELFGIIYKNIIECKDYSQRVTIEKIDALLGKIKDFPNIKPIYATTLGYQKGAKTKAIKAGVELLIVRKQNENDWQDKDGNQLLKFIHIDITFSSNIRVDLVNPFLDKKWIEENTDFNLATLCGSSNNGIDDVIIKDHIANTEKRIEEYYQEINKKIEPAGKYKTEFNFDDAYIIIDGKELKIKALHVEYTRPELDHMPIDIDYSQQLYGVIEYLNSKKKRKIFINGKIINEEM